MNQDKIKFGNEAETSAQMQDVKNEQEVSQEQSVENIQSAETQEQVIADEFDIVVEDDNEFENKIATLEAALLASEEKVRAQNDEVLRSRADIENMRRRTEQEIDKARKFALERFAGELLPVLDNLERAVELADKENEALKPMLEGVELTLKTMQGTVDKFGLKELNPQGEPFDPTFHQAMSIQESSDFAPNTVMMVMQKGYALNGRVVRPAMVMVAKAPAGNVNETV